MPDLDECVCGIYHVPGFHELKVFCTPLVQLWSMDEIFDKLFGVGSYTTDELARMTKAEVNTIKARPVVRNDMAVSHR